MTATDAHTQAPLMSLYTRLEGILVEEFRTCQSLHKVVQQERNLLVAGDLDALNDLIEEKEILLDTLGQIEESRRNTVGKIALHYPDGAQISTAEDLFHRVNGATSTRLDRLFTGIGTVIDQIREFNNGNQALALNGLSRVDAVQAYLLQMFQTSYDYSPPNGVPQAEPVLVYDIDQRT